MKFVEMIESNPAMKISDTYQCKLLEKMKGTFTEMEQQMFVTSFYGYLHYNANIDFVVNLDNVWKWIGFTQKVKAKQLLEKNFVIDIDYKNSLYLPVKQSVDGKKHGGHNKEIFIMTIKTFKSLCLKAGTKKAAEIHEYYIKMEEILHETMSEECKELKLQLVEKETHLVNTVIKLKEKETQLANTVIRLEEQEIQNHSEKEMLRQRTILEHFPDNVQCVYYGLIDNKNSNGESLIKFGMSNYLRDRVETHTKTFENFRLVNAFKVENKLQIENEIKKHPTLKSMRRKIKLDKVVQTELLINTLSFEELDSIIQGIIVKIEYSPENYAKLLSENDRLQRENESLKVITTPPTIKPYAKPYIKSDGVYRVGDETFAKLVGTREEVWEKNAYKTTGGLLKSDLLLNIHGKVVSKTKFIDSKSKPSPFIESDKLRRK